MINVYTFENGYLKQTNIINYNNFKNISPIWVDLINPTIEEKKWIKKNYNFIFPNIKKNNINILKKNLKFKKKNIYFYINFLFKNKKNNFFTTLIIFVLKNKILFSLHEYDILVFNLIIKNNKFKYNINYKDILIIFLKYNNEYFINILELIYSKLEFINYNIIKKKNNYNLLYTLDLIIFFENLNSKVYHNLINIKKIINFLINKKKINKDQQIIINQIFLDIKIINNYISFLSEKINFLMDTIVTLININQNKIFKFSSIISIFFLFPTLIASIYGMNFKFIPELDWYFGYPLAILLMILSIFILIIYFYKCKWFE